MTGFSTDYVNQIATNLRDRYKSGFPILKELVQNADDAGAKSLVFGFHAGHNDAADHMLLRGPALWVLNDGEFKLSDRRAIRSFGLNAKAGDAGAIGKFGLGMKSVFHLCESFLYLASANGVLVHDVLNPWKADDSDCSEMHKQWEQVSERDIKCLQEVAHGEEEAKDAKNWFLLWVPLRQRSHVPRGGGRLAAAIIERYPGESPAEDQDFFSDPTTDEKIGSILPLLKNLHQVRFAGAAMRAAYSVKLDVADPGLRIDHLVDDRTVHGTVRDNRKRNEHLKFLVHQKLAGDVPPFSSIKAAESWPVSNVITAEGTREPRPDKAIAETAVMFAHANGRGGRLRLQWAVFLPAEEQRFTYEETIPGTSKEYRIVLHGQFFVDAGRRGIADMDVLDAPFPVVLEQNPPQHVVMKQWNQALAQRSLLPEFLPTLARYVEEVGLKEVEVSELTSAVFTCSAGGDGGTKTGFFKTFGRYICNRYSWVRNLESTGSAWKLLDSNEVRLLPLPAPPANDCDRPWRVLPGLFELKNYEFFDSEAPYLAVDVEIWETENILCVLDSIDVARLKNQVEIEYFANFLNRVVSTHYQVSEVQDLLVGKLRQFLSQVPISEVRENKSSVKRTLAALGPDRLFVIGPMDANSKGALPESLYKKIVSVKTIALVVPGDIAPPGFKSEVSSQDLLKWLDAISEEKNEISMAAEKWFSVEQMLDAAEKIIKAVGDESDQICLIKQCQDLKVLRAFDVNSSKVKAVSLRMLLESHAAARLFKVTDATNVLGLVPRLAAALPLLNPVVVNKAIAIYVESISQSGGQKIPGTDNVNAILRCAGVGITPPLLGSVAQRAELLSLIATASVDDAAIIKGLRYLLHGSAENYSDTKALWKDPVGQNSPWVRLWRMVDQSPWRVLENRLCGVIPDKFAGALNLKAVDENTVISRLNVCESFTSVKAEDFSGEEIDLLLGKIHFYDVWKSLPLHRFVGGEYGALDDSCYLDSKPRLPAGVGSEIKFVLTSSDASHSARQSNWIREWNAKEAAKYVLSAEEPVRYWCYLLDILTDTPELGAQVGACWTEKKWLPLHTGLGIALGSLIDLELLQDDIRGLSRKCEFAFACPADLSDELKSHRAFDALRRQIGRGNEALPVLAQLMSAADMSIGYAPRISYRELKPYINTLAEIEILPAWGIIQKAALATSDDGVETNLLPDVSMQLGEIQCRSVLQSLCNRGDSAALQAIYLSYLKEWKNSAVESELKRALPELKLLNQSGNWRSSSSLVSGVQGVDPSSLLCELHALALDGAVFKNGSAPFEVNSVPENVDDEEANRNLTGDITQYVDPLASSGARQAVGALIGLFGTGVKALATHWLEPIAYADYLNKLGWKDPGYDKVNQRNNWMGGRTLAQALAELRIQIKIVTGKSVDLTSLTGEKISVQLAPPDSVRCLHISTYWNGTSCRVDLHPLDILEGRELEIQREVLMRTAESLLHNLYNQKHANLTEFFSLAQEADQVTLDVARGVILDGIPQTLRLLPGVANNEKISSALDVIDDCRRNIVSAKTAKRVGGISSNDLEAAINNLGALVESDDSVQDAILQAVRARLTDHQYELSSIPFEVFQNADDAATEMQALQKADSRPLFSAEAIGKFGVEIDHGVVRFLYWGRPINYAGRHKNTRLSYRNDLERMLMLGASAKMPSDGVGGKFGLGFKSLLLASTSPKVSSGDLSFEIVAGCLPQKWVTTEQGRKFQTSSSSSFQKGLRSTLVEVPLDEKIDINLIMNRFVSLVGLLPAFSKEVRSIEIDKVTHQWRPSRMELDAGHFIEVGSVTIPVYHGSATCTVIIFRGASGSMVMRLGNSGIEEFDRRAEPPVPAIWVKAPTRGVAARGILINSSFEIDTGRATLSHGAGAVRENQKRIDLLAKDFGPIVVSLLKKSQDSWECVRSELKLLPEIAAGEFWLGFWSALIEDEPSKDAAMDARLIEAFGCTILGFMIARTKLVPNGFKGNKSRLVDASSIRISVNVDYLSSVLPRMTEWPKFISQYPTETWCTDEVRGWLKHLSVESESAIDVLGVETVFRCIPEAQLDFDDVPSLFEIIKLWPKTPGQLDQWRSVIGDVRLRNRVGDWVSAKLLLRGGRSDDYILDEFAPDASLLHHDYIAVEQFRQFSEYLPHFNPEVNTIVDWCIAANSESKRGAVLHWMARNPYSTVLSYFRAQVDRRGWLANLNEKSPTLDFLHESERRSLLQKLGLLEMLPPQVPPLTFGNLDLKAIKEWWDERRFYWVAKFDDRLWPQSACPEKLRSVPYDRSTWMTLFSLGVFRRYGRTSDEQHRGFLEFLEAKGWWGTICEVDPHRGAEDWIDILRAYAEERQSDTVFELWMDSFPRLYRLARWLDEYVHIFQTLDQRDSASVSALLSPSFDSSMSGSGIDAPTLMGSLRLGHHLVIRELLRVGVLSSSHAKEMAFAPRKSVIDLIAEMGLGSPQTSVDIYRVLMKELGHSDSACFDGDYDIPLQLLATDPVARNEASRWADGSWSED